MCSTHPHRPARQDPPSRLINTLLAPCSLQPDPTSQAPPTGFMQQAMQAGNVYGLSPGDAEQLAVDGACPGGVKCALPASPAQRFDGALLRLHALACPRRSHLTGCPAPTAPLQTAGRSIGMCSRSPTAYPSTQPRSAPPMAPTSCRWSRARWWMLPSSTPARWWVAAASWRGQGGAGGSRGGQGPPSAAGGQGELARGVECKGGEPVLAPNAPPRLAAWALH